MSLVFVVNCGSSSIKWQVIDSVSGERMRGGSVDRIGERPSDPPTHSAAMSGILDELAGLPLDAVGHRVVHGGAVFNEPVFVTDKVVEQIAELSSLAPLHNPANLAGITAARAALPGVPQVAVFDTAFHHTLPAEAFTYALDRSVAARYGIRRYGFHGISFRYVSGVAAESLGTPLAALKMVVLHLGNGASACAIDGGRSIDTSMGMTPVEGLVMGSRTGDLDPGAIAHMLRNGLSPEELERVLNRTGGLLGLAGTNDLRDVEAAASAGDSAAALALKVMHRRLRHYIGAYLAVLGGADAIVFTGGIGEHSAGTREGAVAGLESLGIVLDPALNAAHATVVSAADSRIAVLVVPTNEELEIARQTAGLLAVR